MSENEQSANHATSPVDAMFTHVDTPEAQQLRHAMTSDVKKRLVLDPSQFTFASKGVFCLEWTLDNGDTWKTLPIPVKSIGAKKLSEIHENEAASDEFVPRIWDEELQREVLDTGTAEYLAYGTAWLESSIRIQYEKLLYGLDGDLKSVTGDRLVWSATDPSVCDKDAALESLYQLDIPTSKLADITEYIQNLSIKAEVGNLEEFEGKQPPPSDTQDSSTSNGQKPRRRGQRGRTR